MGDCIMAFWNAPLDDELHSEHACTSALAMFKELEVLNAAREKEAEEAGEDFLPLNVGIGINTGDCVVGNMGSEQRFDYSVLGDSVNLAARLEGQSKNYGVKIVIGEDTANQLDGKFATLPLDMIAVKGKTEAVSIFTILGDADYTATPEFQKLHDVHALMIEAYLAQTGISRNNSAKNAARSTAVRCPIFMTSMRSDLPIIARTHLAPIGTVSLSPRQNSFVANFHVHVPPRPISGS